MDIRVSFAMIIIALLLFAFSGVKMLLILVKIKASAYRSKLSNLLLLNILCWTLACCVIVSGGVYYIINILMVKGGSMDEYRYSAFWTAVPGNCMLPVVTWSVFFLSLDRLLLIFWPINYTNRNQRRIATLAVVFLVALYLFNFWAYTWEFPLEHNYQCMVFNCFIQKTGSQVFIYSKISGGFCVILCLLVFLFQWAVKHNKQINQQHFSASKKMVNRLVMIQMSSEICLNFVPQLAATLIFQFTRIVVGTYIGSHNWLFGSIDALITAMVYRRVLTFLA